jgi:hypothetical protein
MPMEVRYALVETASDKIVNMIVWDGESPWSPPEGHTVHLYPFGDAQVGWTWNNGTPTPPAAE